MNSNEAAAILSEPFKIGKLTLKNRIVMSPMAATGSTLGGQPTEQTMAFFRARAKGGVGMIIVSTAGTARAMAETRFPGGIRADTDEYIPELTRLAEEVHAYGIPIIGEISPSMGRMALPAPGRPVISASPVNVVIRGKLLGMPLPGGVLETTMPREATIAEIEAFEAELISTAERLHRIGWDGVELPAIASYFLCSFITPRTNFRTDKYGGSVENRARMLVNIVKGIRERVGPDFIIGLRITANDYMPEGPGAEGFAAIAREVEKAGIDYVALVWGCYEGFHLVPPEGDGANLIKTGDAMVFKKSLSVPIMLSGLHDPRNAAKAIAEGHGDLILAGRPLLADPDFAAKATQGRANDIVRCDRENLCMRRMVIGAPVRCSVNPRMGRESRKPGALPPPDRWLKAPVEQLVLKLSRSKMVMDLVGKLSRRSRADA